MKARERMNTFGKPSDVFTLQNGTEIPCLGFGTWRARDGEEAYGSVLAALRAGYRHIDTAAYYGNETSVGRAVRDSGIDRREIFITSKVWASDRGYETTKAAMGRTLEALGVDCVDLYLIHWPASPSRFADWDEINLASWRAMTELYREGCARAIGVSNFLPHHLESLVKADVSPMVNQIEYHPGYLQSETVDYCRAHGILVEAWSPLGRGRIFEHPLLLEMSARYGRSIAQICIHFCLRNGILPLPKSVTPARIIENTAVFDFELTEDDMTSLREMAPCGYSGRHPDEVDF